MQEFNFFFFLLTNLNQDTSRSGLNLIMVLTFQTSQIYWFWSTRFFSILRCEGWRSTITFSKNCWLTEWPYFPNCTTDQGQKASSLCNAGVSLQKILSLSGKASCWVKKKMLQLLQLSLPLTRKRCHLQMRLRIAGKVGGLCLPN